MASKRVLAVLTTHGVYDDGTRTGLWLSELSHFYEILTSAGYEVDLASVNGGAVPLDPGSIRFARLNEPALRFLEAKKDLFAGALPLSEVEAGHYAAVYFAGGHGTMWDFKENVDIQRLIAEMHTSGGIIAAVCHGVAALISATDAEGNPLVRGRLVTGYSTLEEWLLGKKRKVPYLLENELVAQGAVYSRGWLPFTPYVVVDGRVVTGQNPQSTKKMSRLLVKLLANPKPTAAGNAKCTVCLLDTWVVGLFAVIWGIATLLGFASSLQLPILAVVLIAIGLGFLGYQYPFTACSRCAAASRTPALNPSSSHDVQK